MSNWPDPDKPGVPLNPKVTGEHYIADSVALWFADLRKWAIIGSSKLQTAELLAGQCWAKYIGPCPTSAETDALRAENARLREALVYIGKVCISHDRGDEAGRALGHIADYARAALDPDGQKERRAKALSDLAEMDADLLDIDPETKS